MSLESVVKTAVLIGFGAIEGYAFATSGIAYPAAFRSQMNFSSEILLQLFISAVGSSMVAQGLLSLIAPKKFATSRKWQRTAVGFPRAVGGCFILGCGMAVAGSGPTMLPSQFGVGTTSALAIFGGCLAGGAAYALLEEAGVFSKQLDCKPGEKTVLEQHVGGSYAGWSLSLGAAMIAADAFVVPRLLDVSQDQISLSRALTTPPLVAGLAVGLNQVPIRLITSSGQGGSTSIMNMLALVGIGKKNQLKSNFSSMGQMLYVWGGTMLGAYLASQTLSLPAPAGFSQLESFVGGFLMLFGARIANGCACGHGVSGFSELGVQSMAAAAAIFAGGIATVVLGKLATSP